MKEYKEYKFGTEAVHGGYKADPTSGAKVPPIVLSTTFLQEAPGVHKGFDYTRSGNPSRQAFETAVARLEKASYSLAFASGSATTATILNLLSTNSHVICVNDVYGGTYRYLTKVAPSKGLNVDFIDLINPENIKSVLKSNTKLVWIETPTNPTLRLVDIAIVTNIVHKFDPEIIVVVDNTFLSPYFQNPLSLGADIVVHSVTKYLNGHCDVLMGVAVTNNFDLYEKVKFLQNSIGAVPSPFDCYLALRGIKTLHLRMEQHAKNAMAIATFLEHQQPDKIEKVYYPGLKSHPQHGLALKQQRGFGGMISFVLKGTAETAALFLKKVKIFALAESLGGVESLIELPAIMTHGSVSAEDRALLGITDTFIRMSVGIEDTDDLIEDLKQALDATFATVTSSA